MAGYRLPLEFAEELVKTVAADKKEDILLCRSEYRQKYGRPRRCFVAVVASGFYIPSAGALPDRRSRRCDPGQGFEQAWA